MHSGAFGSVWPFFKKLRFFGFLIVLDVFGLRLDFSDKTNSTNVDESYGC